MELFSDTYFMREALKEARQAAALGEVPVGAVVVHGHQILGRGHNQTERLGDVTAHAELLAFTAAAQSLGSKYLPDCTLYVTLEPCLMCAGALAWGQIGRIVVGAADPKRGFLGQAPQGLHPKTIYVQGVLEEECRALMQNFFKAKR